MNQIIVESGKPNSSQVTRTIVGGIAAVLVFDTLASLTSLMLSIDYGYFAIGSAFIYFLVGFLAARRSSFVNSLIAVFFVALADLTLGWVIAWFIGPGSVEEGLSASIVVLATISVVPFSLFFGALGGYLANGFTARPALY